MHIPQDVVDFIIDQLVRLPYQDWSTRTHRCLQAASLVSTAWVNRSQHYLFSTVEFSCIGYIQKWCSRIRPDPCGVSRHVRVLTIRRDLPFHHDPSPLDTDILETALPHLISFPNLQKLELCHIGPKHTSLDFLVPVFSSFAGTLKHLLWDQDTGIGRTWEVIRALAGRLPNLEYFDLSGRWDDRDPTLPDELYGVEPSVPFIKIRLTDGGRPFAFERFEFRELEIFELIRSSPHFFEPCGPRLQVLDFRGLEFRDKRQPSPIGCGITHVPIATFLTGDREVFKTLLETCHTLQVLGFSLSRGITRFMGSIPSNSISLINLANPFSLGHAPMAYDNSWPWKSFEEFEGYLSYLEKHRVLTEFMHMGASIRKIAQRFSDHHPGSKTRLRARLGLYRYEEAREVFNGRVPFFKASLEKELGGYVDLKLTVSHIL